MSDSNLHQSIKAYLEMEDFVVESAFCSQDVYSLTYENKFDLYIFDVQVPGDNGFDKLFDKNTKNINPSTEKPVDKISLTLIVKLFI